MSTHWEGCWENENHAACRLKRIRELEREVAALRSDAAYIMAHPIRYDLHRGPHLPEQSETVWCGGDEREAFVAYVGEVDEAASPSATYHPTPDRIPGSASWTMPAVDEPPVVADVEHPVSRHPQGNV